MPIIRPEITITPDCPTVKFREDPQNTNLAIEIPKVLTNQGWALGTIFCVQFVDHDKTKVIKVARFIVNSENSSLQTFNPDGPQPMTKLVEAREACQIEAWFYPAGAPVKMDIDWNFGEKKHRVMLDGKVIARFDKKPQAEEYIKKAA